jgi:exopolysaccharide biosynthesis polyprenyl glycosylphosphotransferase
MLFRALSRKGVGDMRTLLVGDGSLALECYRRVQASTDPLWNLVGYCDRRHGQLENLLPELGPVERLDALIRDHDIARVIVALPSTESERILSILRHLGDTSVSVTLLPDLFAMVSSATQSGDVCGIPAVHLEALAIHGIQGQMKQILDICLAGVGLVVISPLLLLVAILVRLDSAGPIFYLQERIGLDGRTFRMIKFRSMRVDAEAQTGPVWAKMNDPRRTRLGAWLRKYSVDELPQLVNVLRGEMSLVGPRPERPSFVEEFRGSVPQYMSRHRVKSGITGWAQISGMRGQSPIEERTRYDIWYIQHWSLWLDFKILVRTLYVCIFYPTGY